MRLLKIEWGKFKLEVPVEILYLLFKAFLMVHFMDR